MSKDHDDVRSRNNGNSTLPIFESSRLSMDTTANLNDDLENESDISGSIISQPVNGKHPGSITSYRNSIDAESSFSSSVYFQNFNTTSDEGNVEPSSFSPLGPNSIYELTIASDVARQKRKAEKIQVTLNGGMTTVYNLKTPTTRDIPPIQLEKLENKVRNDDIITKLITDIDEEYKKFDHSYNSLTADTLQKLIDSDKPLHKHSSSDGNVSLGDINEDETIPPIFSDENFRLDDPRIFNQVIGDHNILPGVEDFDSGGISKQSLANNNQLQDKLSHYLDLVEINLIDEISKTSSSFFNTIEDIKDIQNKSNECVEEFQIIKQKLASLENDENKAGLKILDQIIERNNVEKLEASLIQIKYVISVHEAAQISLSQGNNAKCLNNILLAEGLIHGDSSLTSEDSTIHLPKFRYPLIDLSKLPALFHIQSDLQTLKDQCSRGYIIDFNDLLITDLKHHYKNVPLVDTLNRMYYVMDKTKKKYSAKDLNTSYNVIDNSTKEKLKDYVENLAKSGHLSASFQAYQDRIITEIKDIIKFHLPKAGQSLVELSNAPSKSYTSPEPNSSQGEPAAHTSSSLSSSIKALTPKEFERMLVNIFCGLSECLRRLTVHQKVLLDLALSSIPPTEEIDVMVFDLTLAINKAIELTQLRLSRIINVRSEQLADLSVAYYLRFYSLCSAYFQECELINPGYVASGSGNSLNDWAKSHTSYFIYRFHQNCSKNTAHEIDREIWKEVSDPQALSTSQAVVDELIKYSSLSDKDLSHRPEMEEWLSPLVLYDYREMEASTVPEQENKSRLTVGDESFLVPKVVLSSLPQIRDYLIILSVFQNKSDIIETNLLNYLKLINTKTAHAVLNAGATRTAGLKHITTKHLALCIQDIEFHIGLLDNISSAFQGPKPNLPQQQSNNQPEELTIGKVLANFKEHENELCAKLVSIMHDRTKSHCEAATKVDWTQPLSHPVQCHPYMETLVKETTTVAKVLQKYLSETKYSLILLQIFNTYKKLLVECFCTRIPQFKDFNEKHALLKDIDFFRVKLSDLPGYGNSGQVIWENVNALPTLEDARMEEVMRSNIEGERKQNSEIPKSERPSTPQKDDGKEKRPSIPSSEPVEDGQNSVVEVKEHASQPDVSEAPGGQVTGDKEVETIEQQTENTTSNGEEVDYKDSEKEVLGTQDSTIKNDTTKDKDVTDKGDEAEEKVKEAQIPGHDSISAGSNGNTEAPVKTETDEVKETKGKGTESEEKLTEKELASEVKEGKLADETQPDSSRDPEDD